MLILNSRIRLSRHLSLTATGVTEKWIPVWYDGWSWITWGGEDGKGVEMYPPGPGSELARSVREPYDSLAQVTQVYNFVRTYSYHV